LKLLLAGAAPINKESQDSYIWDPIGGKFTIKSGYNFLQKYHNYENWNLWTTTWKNECLPKIKKFAWTLLKGKIPIEKNLRKKGFQGPSICVMCQREEESIQHLFLKCIIARQCWKQIISPLEMNIDTFEQLTTLNVNWEQSYPYARKKTVINRIWKCLPSTLCWHLWLARNKYIFKGQKPNIGTILAKTWGQISEMISANGVPSLDQNSLQQEEKDWYKKSLIKDSARNQLPKKVGRKIRDWKLRGNDKEMEEWIKNQRNHILFFDRASKNNPGRAGEGGLILDLKGETIATYEWGLGTMTYNRAETYNLLMGTNILKKYQLKDPIIIGDLAIIIVEMEAGRDLKNLALNKI